VELGQAILYVVYLLGLMLSIFSWGISCVFVFKNVITSLPLAMNEAIEEVCVCVSRQSIICSIYTFYNKGKKVIPLKKVITLKQQKQQQPSPKFPSPSSSPVPYSSKRILQPYNYSVPTVH